MKEDFDYYFTTRNNLDVKGKDEEYSEENKAIIKTIENDDLESLQQIASSPLFDINMRIIPKSGYSLNLKKSYFFIED